MTEQSAAFSSSSAVPPGNCVTHGYHGRTFCPRCSTSALPPPPLTQGPSAAWITHSSLCTLNATGHVGPCTCADDEPYVVSDERLAEIRAMFSVEGIDLMITANVSREDLVWAIDDLLAERDARG